MYGEVTMVEVTEVLRLWRTGPPRKRLAAQLGLDPKAVRRYLKAATTSGVRADGGAVTDDEVRDTLLALQPVGGGQSIDPHDYPAERSVYALRNVTALQQLADQAGAVIGRFAAARRDSPLPWTRMRRLLPQIRRRGRHARRPPAREDAGASRM